MKICLAKSYSRHPGLFQKDSGPFDRLSSLAQACRVCFLIYYGTCGTHATATLTVTNEVPAFAGMTKIIGD